MTTGADARSRHLDLDLDLDLDRLWLTDITEHPAGEGTLYFCAVKEAF